MEDCCKDKTSPYDIRPEEKKLIEAAIGLADWLAARSEVTGEQLNAIFEMRSFLKNLPSSPPPGFNAEIGFSFESDDDPDQGEFGCWGVSVCRAGFEIFFFNKDDADEFEWILCPGETNRNSLKYAQAWIDQVADPVRQLPQGHRFVIEASTWSTDNGNRTVH